MRSSPTKATAAFVANLNRGKDQERAYRFLECVDELIEYACWPPICGRLCKSNVPGGGVALNLAYACRACSQKPLYSCLEPKPLSYSFVELHFGLLQKLDDDGEFLAAHVSSPAALASYD
jgi:hypothetical protein